MKRAFVLAAAGVALVAGCGSSGPHYAPVAAPKVSLGVTSSLTQPLRIGVVVSGASLRGEGADDLPLAAGARVAQYRLSLGSAHPVTLDVVDDHGTSTGSTAAVRQLVSDHVAGIVYASEGHHLEAGLAEAATARVAVLLPYATDEHLLAAGDTAWLTGPTEAEATSTVSAALAARKIVHPLVLATAPVQDGLTGLADGEVLRRVQAGPRLAEQVEAAVSRARKQHVDGVVVWGPSQTEADVVAALQQTDAGLPVMLGPDAIAPSFGAELHQLGSTGNATTAGDYQSVGVPAGDTSASPSVAAFLAAVRIAARDAAVQGVDSQQLFATAGAATADTRSHDAVLAIAAAAAAAHSTQPAAVLAALNKLRAGASVGIAGPPLDFTKHTALAGAGSVTVLQATTQDSGQRTGVQGERPALQWFAVSATDA